MDRDIPTFGDAEIRAALDLDVLREAMAATLADLSAGRCDQPIRSVVQVPDHGGYMFVMSARTPTALGAKLVTLFPGNVDVPTHHAIVTLFDVETGVPVATLDGSTITELRTAAVSAAAADRLARPDASTLAILGSGVQAASHLDALRRVRAFTEIRVWSRRGAGAFATAHPGVTASASAEEAARGADVVVTVTGSREPVLSGAWLAPGAFIAAVGAPRPDWRELGDDLLATARIVADSRAAAVVESGDILRALELGNTIAAELGEVVDGTAPGRTSPDETILFKSLGQAVEDVAAGELVLRGPA